MKNCHHQITVFSDFACPFCYIGKGLLKKLDEEYSIKIDWIPFELSPDLPKEGALVADEYPDLDLAKMLKELNERGAPYGVKFNTIDKIPNTRLALEAAEFARKVGKLDEFQEIVYQALFIEGQDIGQEEVVLTCGEKAELNLDKLKEALEKKTYYPHLKAGRKLGEENKVGGVPTFLINDKTKIVGSQSYQTFVDILEKV